MKPCAEQLALLPVAQGNSSTSVSAGMKRLVRNHTEDTITSMQLMAQTMRCCWFERFFLLMTTWDMIIQEPSAESADVNFGSIAKR